MITVSRCNMAGLNPDDWLLDGPEEEGGKPMEFGSRKKAEAFLRDAGVTDDKWYQFTFHEEAEEK